MNRIISNIDKALMVHPLLLNSNNKNIRHFLSEYILLMKSDGINDSSSGEMKRLDTCIEYLCSIDFNSEGWMIWEIPVFYSHCFWNMNKEQAFDLVVWDIGKVIVRYLNDELNEADAESIDDAINKYCMDGYILSKQILFGKEV